MANKSTYTPRQTKPYIYRDMSRGVYRQAAVVSHLAPTNSVSHAMNVNFDTIIGSAVVRKGTQALGNVVAAGKTPLGLYNFVGVNGAPNLMLVVFSGATPNTATLYYYDTSWHASNITTLSNTAKNRFATLGGWVFRVNGVSMKSSQDGASWATTNCITTDSVVPTLIWRAKGRLIVAGYPPFQDRVYFSSIVDMNSAPSITWNTNQATGDWIDINPDDGDQITAFAETSNQVLVFKSQGMYRLDVVNKTTDSQNIFNIGAVSQEAVVNCQGTVYFFSGIDIRSTVGDYPQQISRLGVQDFIDAIPQANWSKVCAGTDGLNVYFSIGNVTLFTNKDEQVTYTNVVLKYSTRDQSWSVHYYKSNFLFFDNFVTSNGFTLVGAQTVGFVETLNIGTSDSATTGSLIDGAPIFFDLQTQEIDFGNRAIFNEISDEIVVFGHYGIDSEFYIQPDDDDFKPLNVNLSKRVNVCSDVNVSGHYFTFRWLGNSQTSTPVFEGFYIEKIADLGILE